MNSSLCSKEFTFDDLDALEEERDADDNTARRFVLKKFESDLEAEGALYALRILSHKRVFRRVFQGHDYIDDDILALVGMEVTGARRRAGAVTSLRSALALQMGLLESGVSVGQDLVGRNIYKLGRILRLSELERRILRFALIATKVRGFSELFMTARLSPDALHEVVGKALGSDGRAVGRLLRSHQSLCASGFLLNCQSPFTVEDNPLELNSKVCDVLLSARFDVDRFLRHLIRKGRKTHLTIKDYAHVPDADLARRYLAEASEHHRRGVNILLYGVPGTGKTEFVRAIATALKLQLHEVPNEDDDGDPIIGNRRFAAYALCQRILARRRRHLILFDEVEDVFGSSHGWLSRLFGEPSESDDRQLSKSWTNEILETNAVPTIWVCNDIGAMDHAYLRRYDMVIEFRAPGPAAKRRMLDRYFQPGEISETCTERLAAMDQLPPAQIERAARVVRALGSPDVDRRDGEALRIITASMRAMDLKGRISAGALPTHYDPAFINADRDLDALTMGLRQGMGARLCFYGPPGSGKTAFAHHMGKVLGLPVHATRTSDLLDCFVGETEKKIAAVFQRASDEAGILLIDEADSFLRDRTSASQGWEVTQVNELLTQTEAFEGIFIASTNLFDLFDAASLRRFDFKVKFDYLTVTQRRAMLTRLATHASTDPGKDERLFRRIDRLERLTPGDFTNALRQLRITGEPGTRENLLRLLEAEASLKPEARHRAIGFLG